MNEEVKLVKALPDGRYVFTRGGVYFTLTIKQFEQLQKLFEDINNGNI